MANTIDTATQTNEKITIDSIELSGNKKTKDYIIFREAQLKKGETLTPSQLTQRLELARQLIMNTTLFVEANVYVANLVKNKALVKIEVKERWYLFPLPYFKLVDRNFNQWWVDQKRSLDRINYGIKFIQNNFSGRNDNLNIWLVNGYNKQVSFRYDRPFVDKKLKHGFNIGFIYNSQREINVFTKDNKQVFFKLEDQFVREVKSFDLTYSYRPDVKFRHYIRFSINREWVADTIIKLNPLYYPGGKNTFNYIDLNYHVQYFKVDYMPYPTKGWMFESSIFNRGFKAPNHLLQATAHAQWAVPLSAKSFIRLEAAAAVKSGAGKWFFNQRFFGYGDFQLRGQEFNVVDGVAGWMSTFTIHQEVLKFVLRNPFKTKVHDKIPFRFILKAYTDMGKVKNNNPANNSLANKFMYTGGVGLDIVSIYDFVFKIEYSFNQLGTQGLYLHTRNDF